MIFKEQIIMEYILQFFLNENVILMKFSWLPALEIVKITTSSAATDENFIKMMTFPFQCYNP